MFSLIKTFDFGLSDIIFAAWKVFTKKPLDFVAICLFGSLPYFLVPLLEFSIMGPILLIIAILAGTVLEILMIARIVEALASAREMGFLKALRESLPKWGIASVAWCGYALGGFVITLLPSLMFRIVPDWAETVSMILATVVSIPAALLYVTYFAFVPYSIALRGMGIFSSFEYSMGIVKGRSGRVMGCLLVLYLLPLIALRGLQILFRRPMQNASIEVPVFVLMNIIYVFFFTATAVLFLNLDYRSGVYEDYIEK